MYGGLGNKYKYETDRVFLSRIEPQNAGIPVFPERSDVNAPKIKSSTFTDRKKTNAQICYTRVVSTANTVLVGNAKDVVFVSKSMSRYDGSGVNRRSVIAGLDYVNAQLENSAKLYKYQFDSPLDNWRSLSVIREWTPDGILLGPTSSDADDCTLNVCVAGNCIVRNSFDGVVYPLDTWFLCLVASNSADSMSYTFQYVTCSSRMLNENTSSFIKGIIGAWKIGRVVDRCAATLGKRSDVELSIAIEWVDWRHLRRQFRTEDIADNFNKATLAEPDAVLIWPSRFLNNDASLAQPKVQKRSKAEIFFTKAKMRKTSDPTNSSENSNPTSPPSPPKKTSPTSSTSSTSSTNPNNPNNSPAQTSSSNKTNPTSLTNPNNSPAQTSSPKKTDSPAQTNPPTPTIPTNPAALTTNSDDATVDTMQTLLEQLERTKGIKTDEMIKTLLAGPDQKDGGVPQWYKGLQAELTLIHIKGLQAGIDKDSDANKKFLELRNALNEYDLKLFKYE